jgi:tetratricopeptide (TPR) repeat protein
MTAASAGELNMKASDQDIPSYDDLKQDAIDAALKHDWEKAIQLNQILIKKNQNDLNGLNRLAFAYMKFGKYKDAVRFFNKVKSIDPYNKIAQKNLSRLSNLNEKNISPDTAPATVSPMHFLEDPGKTKLVKCVNVAPSQTISTIYAGQEVFLKAKNHNVEVRDNSNRYLGALPDDLSFRLLKLISAKNRYSVFIRSVDKGAITILIREIERGKKFAFQPSFLPSNLFHPVTSRVSGNKDKPDVTPTGEEDDSDNREGNS